MQGRIVFVVGVVISCLIGPSLVNAAQCPSSGRAFIFSHSAHQWYACSNGVVINQGTASGGQGYCRDTGRSCRTPRGYFKLQSKGGSGCRSSRYPVGRGGAWMGYCMFFTPLYAIHASSDVPKRRHASHGCIRVKPDAARWLNQEFLHVGDRVIVN